MICETPYYVEVKGKPEKVPVPCGRCPVCKRKRVESWVFRLMQEERVSLSAHFVTLTYDNEHLPFSPLGYPTLEKSDFQLYMKRLRKLCPNSKIKYYAVGEYGGETKRPHYHFICFNVPRETLFYEAWHLDGKHIGQVHVGHVTADSVAYVMKYIDKPTYDDAPWYMDRNREFSLMSKGLGSSYLTDEVIDYHRADLTRVFLTEPGGRTIGMPRYYKDRLYFEFERKFQGRMAEQAAIEQEKRDRRQFAALKYPTTYTFEQWKDSRRSQRYKDFYSRIKKRDKL